MTFRTLLARLQAFAKDNPDHEALDGSVIVRLQTREDNGHDLHVGGLRSIAVDEGCTETFALTLDADQDPTEPDDDPIIDVLHRVLANRTGKLRVSDAYRPCPRNASCLRIENVALEFRLSPQNSLPQNS